MDRFIRCFSFIEDWLSGLLLVAGLGVLLLQVILRYFTDIPTTWQDEIGRYLVVWGTLIGASVALRDGKHIEVSLLFNFFPSWLKKSSTVFTNLLLLLFFFLLIKYGVQIVHRQYTFNVASTNGFQLWYVYLILPVSGGLMFIQTILNIFKPPKETDIVDDLL